MPDLIAVRARSCPYDPSALLGVPLGMFHCPSCGCMVVAGLEHGPCFPSFCPAAEEGWHPGPLIEVRVAPEDLPWLGLPSTPDGGPSQADTTEGRDHGQA